MSDLTALEARMRDLVHGALQAARQGGVVDWRTRPDVLADEMIRWVADVVEDETADLRAELARAQQAMARVRAYADDLAGGPNHRSFIADQIREALAADAPAATMEETHRRDEHEQQACPTPGCSICEGLWLAATGEAIPDAPAASEATP